MAIAAALAAAVVVSLLYLRADAPAPIQKVASTPAPTMSGPDSVDYDFISPTTGWAFVVDYFQSALYIFKTADAGAHWREQFRYRRAHGDLGARFFDPSDGYVSAGDQVFRTDDGGTTWVRLQAPPGDVDFGSRTTFASPKLGWSVTSESGRRRVYATTDGGASWSLVRANLPDGTAPEFRESGEGWLGTDFSSHPTVWRTLDGGARWQEIRISTVRAGQYMTSVRLLPGAGVLVAVSGEFPMNAFISADQGATWREVVIPDQVANADDLLVADGSNWWGMPQDGSVFTTADAGRTWFHPMGGELPALWNLEARGIIDAGHAWRSLLSAESSTKHALEMTSDGGEHWRFVKPPQPE